MGSICRFNPVKHSPKLERANKKTRDDWSTVQKCYFCQLHGDRIRMRGIRIRDRQIHADPCGSGTPLTSCLGCEHISTNLNTLYCLLEHVDHSFTVAPVSLEKKANFDFTHSNQSILNSRGFGFARIKSINTGTGLARIKSINTGFADIFNWNLPGAEFGSNATSRQKTHPDIDFSNAGLGFYTPRHRHWWGFPCNTSTGNCGIWSIFMPMICSV